MDYSPLQEIERRLLGSKEGSSRHGRSSCGTPSTPGKESAASPSASPHSTAASRTSDAGGADNLSSNVHQPKKCKHDGGGEGR